MKYKLLNYRIEANRLVLTIEKTFLGFFKKKFECIDSDNTYVNFGITVWYFYPSFKKIEPTSKLMDFCEQSKTYSNHFEKIKK